MVGDQPTVLVLIPLLSHLNGRGKLISSIDTTRWCNRIVEVSYTVVSLLHICAVESKGASK